MSHLGPVSSGLSFAVTFQRQSSQDAAGFERRDRNPGPAGSRPDTPRPVGAARLQGVARIEAREHPPHMRGTRPPSEVRIIDLLRLLLAGEKVSPVGILPVEDLFLLGRELPRVVGEHVEPPLLVEAEHPLALYVSSVVKPPDDVFRVALHPSAWYFRGIPSFARAPQY